MVPVSKREQTTQSSSGERTLRVISAMVAHGGGGSGRGRGGARKKKSAAQPVASQGIDSDSDDDDMAFDPGAPTARAGSNRD